jgi:hypothetical protein
MAFAVPASNRAGSPVISGGGIADDLLSRISWNVGAVTQSPDASISTNIIILNVCIKAG